MSLMVSRRPSSRNQSNDAFWMSIRFGRSRTCFRREKPLRARGATAPLVNYEASLENGLRICRRTSTAGTGQLSETGQACARGTWPPRRSPASIAQVSWVPERPGALDEGRQTAPRRARDLLLRRLRSGLWGLRRAGEDEARHQREASGGLP